MPKRAVAQFVHVPAGGAGIATGAGTDATTGFVPLPTEGSLRAVSVFPDAVSQAPLRTHVSLLLGQPGARGGGVLASGWIASDANYTDADSVSWQGDLPLAVAGVNGLFVAVRNDTGATVKQVSVSYVVELG